MSAAAAAVPMLPEERSEYEAKVGKDVVDACIRKGRIVVLTREQMGVQYGNNSNRS